MGIEQRNLSVSISEINTLVEGHPVIIGLIVLVVGGLFKWIWNRVFGGKDRRSESDPQSLTKALHRYEELIDEYEPGPETDLIALYLGRGAVSYINDPCGALAAYTRVT